MSYNIELSSDFKRRYKNLLKKHASLTEDFRKFLESLKENPAQGIPLGKNCYKIRLQITSKNKGKSGGARIITYVRIQNETVYLLSIYDKSEQSSIADKEIEMQLKNISTLFDLKKK